jgi:RNA polymerase sigma-70 factor (ECF subfamily)
MDREQQFDELRPLLFSLAYRMLGVRADAEDVVQDAYVRWRSAKESEIRSPKSYLTTVVARLSLDALKAAHHTRETYIGPWLPEPLVEPLGTQPIEMAESLSLAFLHLLESLSPAERVAFLLREVFEADYSEIAQTLDSNEANCRQIVTRARQRLQNRRSRFPVDPARHKGALQSFLSACALGDPSQLTSMLAEDAILYSDGGGKVAAALNPIAGADRVARFIAGIVKKGAASAHVEFVDVNGEPGALFLNEKQPASVLTIELGEDGLVTRVFIVRNPEKLSCHPVAQRARL